MHFQAFLGVFGYGQKSRFLAQKGLKREKIDFSQKHYFLHFLATSKQKIAKKSKNTAKNGVFDQKGVFLDLKKGTKVQKSTFNSNFTFYTLRFLCQGYSSERFSV